MSLASDVGRLEVLQSTQLLDSEPEPAFDRLTRLAANLLGAPTALVSLVDAHRQFFKSAFGLTGQLARDRETPLSHSFCKYVARDRAPLVVGDARQHPVLRNSPAIRDYSVIAYAGIPLVVEDEAIGAFCVVDDKPREWSPDKIQVLQDLADSVVSERSPTRSSPRTTSPTGGARRWLREARDSYALEQALLDTALENIEDGVALIDSASRILVANRAFAAMLAMRVDQVVGLTRKDFVAHVGPLLAEPAGFAEALDAQPPNVAQEFTFARPRRRVLTRTWTKVPAAGGDAILVTWHDVTAERDLLREREQLLLVDALTGIPNRRAAENALRTEQERKKRMGTPLCVALFDIDYFKKVNDVHGHAAGDEVLRIVAGSLAGEARLTDTIARWGGEEFLAVLSVPLDGARTFCERARQVSRSCAARRWSGSPSRGASPRSARARR